MKRACIALGALSAASLIGLRIWTLMLEAFDDLLYHDDDFPIFYVTDLGEADDDDVDAFWQHLDLEGTSEQQRAHDAAMWDHFMRNSWRHG